MIGAVKSRLWSLLGGSTLLFWAGCADREATVYDVPKETATPPAEVAAMPMTTAPYAEGGTNAGTSAQPVASTPPMVTASDNMTGRTLPASALNQAGNPHWAIPTDWQIAPAGAMRRATFTVPGGAEVAITSFPGDVGGDLANVNRWRRQIGLGPIGPEGLSPLLTPTAVACGAPAQIVRLQGGTQSTLAAIVPHEGSTWFAKLTADEATIDQQAETFATFITSWDFHAADHAPVTGY